ncbi:MAG: ABC transporter permease [Lentisphaeria bacterium]|nr:ABC transporter permease [Lentisphaeria bacterium]
MMRFTDIVSLSFLNLRLHKTRSLLTSLGVIFGVGSVISMMAISKGAERSALSQIESMGIDKIIIYTKKPHFDTSGGGSSGRGAATSSVEDYGLDVRDYQFIRTMENVHHITTIRNTRQPITKGETRLDLKLCGVSLGFMKDTSCHLTSGRWFNEIDFREPSTICVIGQNVKHRLFPLGATDVVGSNIRTPYASYRIIGVISNDNGTSLPEVGSPNDLILIPSNTDLSIYGNYASESQGRNRNKAILVDYDVMLVNVANLEYIDNTSKRLQNYLDKAHAKTKDWDMIVPLDLLKQRERTQKIFTIVMGAIASISLLVGGIGIMNIMLASVSERKKEIGTRRALGAQKFDILFQFLIETVILTTLGGCVGIGLGLGLSEIVKRYAEMPTEASMTNIIGSLLISSFVGVIFGTYPAWRAAQQNPIDVLRSE